MGDFGDIEADENGIASFQFTAKDIHFMGPYSIIGRGMVIHVGPDRKGRGSRILCIYCTLALRTFS